MVKNSIKQETVLVPQSLEEAAEFLRMIGQEQRKLDRIKSETNEKIEKIKATAMEESRVHEKSIDQLVKGLFIFAHANRDKLTESGKKKTIELPTGSFGWRLTPPAVSLKNVKEVISTLKSLALHRFIRVKEEVDKEAMLKEPEVVRIVKGVSITQREEFIVKPVEVELEISSDTEKFKKFLEVKK